MPKLVMQGTPDMPGVRENEIANVVRIEDSGQAMYFQMEGDNERVFVEIKSWHEGWTGVGTPAHPEMLDMVGKPVKVTIEW